MVIHASAQIQLHMYKNLLLLVVGYVCDLLVLLDC